MKILREYDKQVEQVFGQHQMIRDAMISGSGWQKSDGSIKGVFKKRTGETCIWSARWSTSAGILIPDDWYKLEQMKSNELLAELADIIARYDSQDASALMLDFYQENITDRWFEKLLKTIRGKRGKYSEYICRWDPPPPLLLKYPRYRPAGWGPPIKTPTITTKKAAYAAGRAR